MATPETVQDILAFVAEFGNHPTGTHVSSRIALYPFLVSHLAEPLPERNVLGGLRWYEVNEAGAALAARSPLAKCLGWLREQGFQFDTSWGRRKRWSGSFLVFVHQDGRTAFISSWSRVYVKAQGKSSSELAFSGKRG